METEEAKLQEILQIERENISLASNGITYTNVWFLGKDRDHRDYWFVPNNRDRVFVNAQADTWFEYDLAAISELPKSLNPKGIRERGLL